MQAFLDWLKELSPLWILVYSLGAAVVLLFLLEVILRLARRTRFELDDKIIGALRRPLFLTLVFVGAGLALRKTDVTTETVATWYRILITIAIMVWMRALMRISDLVLEALATRVDDYKWVDKRSLPLFEITSKIVILGFAVWGLMTTWKLNPGPWLASAGIVGIAVGFAAKDTLANLFAGIFIIADAPYKLGDFIILDSGERGRVTDIGIRSTRLLTRDDIEVTIPNAVIANAKIINETGGPFEKERVRVNVGVAYGSDIDQVREVLMQVAKECELIAESPPPTVRFRDFGDSALIFQLRGYINRPVLRGRAVDHLNTAIYKSFAKEKIEIPFPQRDVHMRQA